MKANFLAWALLLMFLGNGCDRQPATSVRPNQPANNASSKAIHGLSEAASGLTAFTNSNSEVFTEDTIEQTRAKAEKGDAEAQFNLAIRYLTGNGVLKNW